MGISVFDTHRQISAIIYPYKSMRHHFSESDLFSSEKTCDVVLEATKKRFSEKLFYENRN